MIQFNGQNVSLQIEGLQYNPTFTIANMYQYLQQNYGVDSSQIDLTIDGQTMFNSQDQTQISQYFSPDSTLYVLPKQQPMFSVYVDGQQVLQQQLENMPIINFLQGMSLGQNYQVDFYDGNTNAPLFQNASLQSNLYDYTNGLQNIIINLTAQVSQPIGLMNPIPNNQVSPQISNPYPQQKSQSQSLDASKLLQSLILFKNVSLLIDPNSQFAVYKFHFPTLVQGYLQKSKGKEASSFHNFNAYSQDWKEKYDVKYCSIDDYGFAISWDDGTISSVRIKQQ